MREILFTPFVLSVLATPLVSRAETVHIDHFETTFATTVGELDDGILTIVYDQRDGNLTAAIGGGRRFGHLSLELDSTAPFTFNEGASNWESILEDTPAEQSARDIGTSQFSIGQLLAPGLDEQALLDNLTITYRSGCFPTRCLFTENTEGDLFVTNQNLVLPPPPDPLPIVIMNYDHRTGALIIGGSEGIVFSTVTVEIKKSADGALPPDDFLFDTAAPVAWDGRQTFQTRDEPKLQGFITVPGLFGDFLMEPGDVIGSLLPANRGRLFLDHIEVRANIVGVAGVGPITLRVIPEPSGLLLSVMGAVLVLYYRCRRAAA